MSELLLEFSASELKLTHSMLSLADVMKIASSPTTPSRRTAIYTAIADIATHIELLSDRDLNTLIYFIEGFQNRRQAFEPASVVLSMGGLLHACDREKERRYLAAPVTLTKEEIHGANSPIARAARARKAAKEAE